MFCAMLYSARFDVLVLVLLMMCPLFASAGPTTTAATAASGTRRCYPSQTNTMQITNNWLEFCPCGTRSIDATDGNDNGCVSIQIAKVTTTDRNQVVFGDLPVTPFSALINEAVFNATTGDVISGGSGFPEQQPGRNFYALPDDSAYTTVTTDTYVANYGNGATLTGIFVTRNGTISLDNGTSIQQVRAGDRLLSVKCNADRNFLDHNVYLRIKVFGQPTDNIANLASFIDPSFLRLVLTTDSLNPPSQISYTPATPSTNASAADEPALLSVANVFGPNWVRVYHKGERAHQTVGSVDISPSFVFGVQLLPVISLITTTTTTLAPNATVTTTRFVGGAPARTTTPIPAAAPTRSETTISLFFLMISALMMIYSA